MLLYITILIIFLLFNKKIYDHFSNSIKKYTINNVFDQVYLINLKKD